MSTTITSITPDGSFNTDNGRLYAFFYELEDGTQGVANHKSERSPFNVGDEVDYQNNGQNNRGDTKLKLSKPGQGGSFGRGGQQSRGGGSRPPQTQNRAATGNGTAPLGVTIGMAINNAALDMRAYFEPGNLGDEKAAKRFLWERASMYLRLSQSLEGGDIAAPVSTPVREPAPAARETRRTAPVTEREAANQDSAVDPEDVPF